MEKPFKNSMNVVTLWKSQWKEISLLYIATVNIVNYFLNSALNARKRIN